MLHSKLFQLYQKLDKSDLRQFKKWMYSPFHNEHEDVQRIFEFIGSRSTFNAKTLDKERLWKYLYSTKKYDDGHLRYLMSLSNKVLSNFVGYKMLFSNNFEAEKTLATYFLEQKQVQESQKHLNKAKNTLKKSSQNAAYHYQQYQLEALQFELEGTQNRTRSTNIDAITSHARQFFMITTLRYACIASSHQNLKKEAYAINMLEAVLEEISQQDYSDNVILMIYYHGYLTIKESEKESHFLALKSYLSSDQERLGVQEKREVLLIAINYAIKQLNTGNTAYIRAAFDLYKQGFEEGYLIGDQPLSLFAYSNTVSLGLNLKEFDWVAQFISDKTQFLETKYQENYQHYNIAKLEYERGNLEKAMLLLTQVEYDDLLMNIGAKVILLKIYYQEQSYDALDALLESFRVFLNRKKVLSYHKNNFMNLISLTKKLLHLPHNKTAKAKLRAQIEGKSPLTEKKWLLEQL